MNILVVRNDKLGDFMLSYPSFAIIKRALPQARIYALITQYTQDMAIACPWIDGVILDPGSNASFKRNLTLLKTIRHIKFDAAITLFSRSRIGFILCLARIPFRLAPATKVAQVFYNHRLKQRRSKSEKPEFAYNTDLVKYYLTAIGLPIPNDPPPPFLQFDNKKSKQLKSEFCTLYNIDQNDRLVFLHPGSGGSTNNLSLEQYAQLAQQLKSNFRFTIIVTAGPGEFKTADALSSLLANIPHIVYHSKLGLKLFAQHIQCADLFISGSTGPLHIAGALDVPTAAFYSRRRSATSLRWQTLNSPHKYLAFSPPIQAEECDMSRIDVISAAEQINHKLLSD